MSWTPMDCEQALEFVEAIAAGDVPLAGELREHVESCPRCASALASARRIEATLAGWETPAAPATFTASVLQRVRRDRWKTEQHVDRLFNLAIAVSVIVIVGAALAMFNIPSVWSLAGAAWGLAREGLRDSVRQAAPAVGTYVAAGGLLASAVVMWWWAERRVQL